MSSDKEYTARSLTLRVEVKSSKSRVEEHSISLVHLRYQQG